ncbi:MAG: hypothetical protein WBP16_05785 [Ferruginibacter sp.]
MKILIHKTALACLIVLYAFLVSFHTGDGFVQSSNIFENPGGKKGAGYKVGIVKGLIIHNCATENSVSVTAVGNPSPFKYRLSDNTTCIRYSNSIANNQLLQQEYFFKHTDIGLPPTGIIFPFHHFW